jgi:UDP-N-acetylglucosamine 4-epimerase
VGETTSLNRLLEILGDLLGIEPRSAYLPFRAGDVRHSLATIGLAQELLGYRPTHSLRSGLSESLSWYVDRFATKPVLQRSA